MAQKKDRQVKRYGGWGHKVGGGGEERERDDKIILYYTRIKI